MPITEPAIIRPLEGELPKGIASKEVLPVTVVLAARNEEANIEECLRSLAPAARVILVDSSSTDRTTEIGRNCGAEIVNFNYGGGYPKKRQWALDNLNISTPWTMLVDADERITPKLWQEIQDATASGEYIAYLICKEFHFLGRKLRFGGFSHSAIALFRTGHARFEEAGGNLSNGQDMEVHERLIVSGKVGRLRNPLVHNDYKGLHAYLDRHNKYSTWEAGVREYFLRTGSWGDRTIRSSLAGDTQSFRRFVKAILIRCPGEPWLWFVYHYFLRAGFLEGRRGYIASSIRREYIEQVRAKLYESKLERHRQS
jgi:glycosyltransferase involved in cell wall biosynthesis